MAVSDRMNGGRSESKLSKRSCEIRPDDFFECGDQDKLHLKDYVRPEARNSCNQKRSGEIMV